ncbi:MAG: cadmium-translocating P-type ATPase [Lachnospiraceae bacterium]|nr:cadmium-translocating P-type ATPase [Lachnospiraceae bacterium]
MTKKQKRNLRAIIIAGVLFIGLAIFEFYCKHNEISLNRFVMLAVFLVPYLIVGYPVLRKALNGIKNKAVLDESFLMTIATIGAFYTGENLEACAVMLFYQIGEFFQSYAVGKSRKSIKELMDIAPDTAFIESDGEEPEEVFPDEINIGDIVVVKPGEKVPVDGEIISGSGMINTSNLTGESVPRRVNPGDKIISGCINGDSLIRYKAEKIYEDSTVAKILELVENASEKKSKTENFITRFARVYTPIVVILAVLLAVIPSIIFRNPSLWVYRACTFLVISCPCALVISVPLSFFGGIGAASKKGVLVKGSNYLELLAQIDTLVCDKTGTITEGNFKVTDVRVEEDFTREECIALSYEVEKMSTHPIAMSIKQEAERLKALDNDHNKNKIFTKYEDNYIIENISGKGVIGTSENRIIYVGNIKLMEENGIKITELYEDKKSAICFVGVKENNSSSARLAGIIYISDIIKEDAKSSISDIRACGVKNIIILTGDTKSVGEQVAFETGVDRVHSELLPQDKVLEVEKILEERGDKNGCVAFIGDGINDAPVLSRADVGIAMGSMGSDAAIEAADVVILDDRLSHIPEVIKIARKTVNISKQNIVFAIAVKVITLILGALGIANIWAAVFADVGVAVICILNSMRMLRIKKNI